MRSTLVSIECFIYIWRNKVYMDISMMTFILINTFKIVFLY
nr:MAG TPA: hypothetical protein [Crassvirales sp.]